MASGFLHFGAGWDSLSAQSNIADLEENLDAGSLRRGRGGLREVRAAAFAVPWGRTRCGASRRHALVPLRRGRLDATNDGGHTDYLFAPSRHERLLPGCDLELFEKMLHLIKTDCSIAAVEQNRVLPEGTVFFNERLSFRGTQREERDSKRLRWINAGLRRVNEAVVVSFDPDNGLEVPSTESV